MADTFGALVIALASSTLFVLASAQIAHRVGRASSIGLAGAAVLPELEDLPMHVVAPAAGLIAAGSQLPIVYLIALHAGDLSLVAVAVLWAEVLAMAGWLADLLGAGERLAEMARSAPARRLALRLARVTQHS